MQAVDRVDGVDWLNITWQHLWHEIPVIIRSKYFLDTPKYEASNDIQVNERDHMLDLDVTPFS